MTFTIIDSRYSVLWIAAYITKHERLCSILRLKCRIIIFCTVQFFNFNYGFTSCTLCNDLMWRINQTRISFSFLSLFLCFYRFSPVIFGRCGCFSYHSTNFKTSARSNSGNFLYWSSHLANSKGIFQTNWNLLPDYFKLKKSFVNLLRKVNITIASAKQVNNFSVFENFKTTDSFQSHLLTARLFANRDEKWFSVRCTHNHTNRGRVTSETRRNNNNNWNKMN